MGCFRIFAFDSGAWGMGSSSITSPTQLDLGGGFSKRPYLG